MSSASVSISGSSTYSSGPSIQVGPITITSSAPVNEILESTLQSGDNSFTIPSGTTLIIVQLPAGNTVATKFVGAAAGSTYGVPMLKAGGVLLYQPDPSETTFVLNAASAHANPTSITMI